MTETVKPVPETRNRVLALLLDVLARTGRIESARG